MLNRTAEALFWIGRYMERAENHARLIDVHYHLQVEDDAADGRAPDSDADNRLCKWRRIVETLGSRESYEQRYGVYAEQEVLRYVTLDREHDNSLVCCVNHARGNLRSLREKLPSELWDVVNAFNLWLRDKEPEDMMKESPHLFFGKIKEWTSLFQGFGQSVMPRENEWHFIECGRYLERAENTLRIIKTVGGAAGANDLSSAVGYAYLLAVLKSLSAYQPFRRYYADAFSVEAILEFVMLNRAFPRSVHYAFHALDGHMRQIELQDKQLRTAHERMIRQVGKVKAELDCLERDDLAADRSGAIVGHWMESCRQLGHAFAQTFFRLGEVSA